MAHGHGGARPGAGRKPKSEANQDNGNRISFTNKQISEFLGSSFVAYISRKTITYTEEFKNIFWKRYLDGDNPEQIFFDCGLNPLIIGQNTYKGISKCT